MKGVRYNRGGIVVLAGVLALSIAPNVPAFGRNGPNYPAQSSSGQALQRVVTDDVGRRVVVPADVKRVVTLAPNLTEIVYALGLDDRLVGDTNECDRPMAARLKPHVGEPQNPSLEAIAALHPDLVLATTSINRLETALALERLGIPVYTSDPHTVGGMLDSIEHMAALMGAGSRDAEVVSALRERLRAVREHLSDTPMTHVLFIVWEDPLITIGQNTFVADALRWAGAESVVLSKQNWPQLSLEEVVRLQPDCILFAGHGRNTAATELASLRARPVWKDLQAVERGCVVDVGEDVVRPSPGLVDAIEHMATELHPEAFPVAGSGGRAKPQ